MSIRSKLTLVMLSGFVALYAILGGLLSNSSLGRAIADPGPYPQLRIFEEVVKHIVNEYVEKPDLDKVRIGALRGLTDGLDPYSAYLLPPQVKEYQANKGGNDQTGMVLGQYRGFAYVITVVPNSPADKAGIKAGNVIEYIDGHATRDLDLYDMRSMLNNGAPGTAVEVAVFRSIKSEKVKLNRGAVTLPKPDVQSLEQQIGYIKVPILSEGQSGAVQAALKEALKHGSQKLILDLRGSAGGDLKEGLAVANLFVKSGTLAKVIGRKDKVLNTFEAKPENAITEVPVAVIADLTTAGAGEVVAAAILENQRGEVVGSRTFGVGSEQQIFPLDDGAAMLLTVSRYASPTGKVFMTSGVTPSVEVKRTDANEASTPDDADADSQPAAPRGATAQAPAKLSDDLFVKKAIEVLTSNVKVKKKAA